MLSFFFIEDNKGYVLHILCCMGESSGFQNLVHDLFWYLFIPELPDTSSETDRIQNCRGV